MRLRRREKKKVLSALKLITNPAILRTDSPSAVKSMNHGRKRRNCSKKCKKVVKVLKKFLNFLTWNYQIGRRKKWKGEVIRNILENLMKFLWQLYLIFLFLPPPIVLDLSHPSNIVIRVILFNFLCQMNEFEKRPYQEAIIDTCVKRNSIVYLPTGAGKTYIAIQVMKHFSKQLER